ncbi:MAG: tryptophan synthase subunit alpha [Desulfurivibrionaceae bacterium]|nr:tryptophan synthase subunit alpha [Desulfobulbales bacterium]MDT8334402.1 tryptophan synthase subunit alpha [Desulfurivibrionaceae bacterium]
MQLTEYLREQKAEKKILLMTHLVLGYPSFEVNREVIRQMVDNGVDLIEMQIPFSEPMADGPVILKANQAAIENGAKVRDCLDLAAEITAAHPIPFLFMTYYNILFKYGVAKFFRKAAAIGIRGFIVPDLPPEEGEEFLALAKEYGIAPIMIYAPTSTEKRMRELAKPGDGFIYCVARRGVTGRKTEFDRDFGDYMARCRRATDLPLAVGFGIGSRQDVDSLIGQADIAVIGTKTIRLVDEQGPAAVGPFIAGLR